MRLLFAQGPALGLRLVIAILISTALMVWDYQHHQATEKLRFHLSNLATPIIYLSDAPFEAIDHLAKNFTHQQTLLDENTVLRAQILMLQGKLQRLQALEAENIQLRTLLRSTTAIKHTKLMLATVIAIHTSPFRQEFMLNKGAAEGVFVGQAVLDAYGIMGQVIEVSQHLARVLLLTDSRSAIPIRDNRSGLHGILEGQGHTGVLTWIDVPVTADVQIGDTLVSSGLGGHYPVGYPVGNISIINRHSTNQFLAIQVVPSAKMYSSQQVLLIWPQDKKSL